MILRQTQFDQESSPAGFCRDINRRHRIKHPEQKTAGSKVTVADFSTDLINM